MSMRQLESPQSLADTCNVAYALNIIGGKWKISIIWELADGESKRLSLLRRKLIGISEGVLIAQLKGLEHDGLVKRIDFKEIPPHVEYRLTPLAKLLLKTLSELEQWGNDYRQTSQKLDA